MGGSKGERLLLRGAHLMGKSKYRKSLIYSELGQAAEQVTHKGVGGVPTV